MTFLQAIAATLAANMLTVTFCYVLWRVGVLEKSGRDASMLQLIVLAAVPLVMAYGAWTLR